MRGRDVRVAGRATASRRSVRALEATNFFVADVQTGLGPFLAAYLASSGWDAARVGYALTFGGIVTVVLQTPAGALVDRMRNKRLLLCVAAGVLAVGALLLAWSSRTATVLWAQALIGGAGPFLGPTLAAITLGLVGARAFDRQYGRNQSFNSAGNVTCAALVAWVSRRFGNAAIFLAAAALVGPTIVSALMIRGDEIDFDAARGGTEQKGEGGRGRGAEMLRVLARDRVLLTFLLCAFLFHFANAAMLPQLGEMLSRGGRGAAAFMAACITVTQMVITVSAAGVGRLASRWGRKPLLLVGFGVLPVRAALCTVLHATAALIAVQVLDGVANSIFGVVSVLVVADRTRGTGRFNLVQGRAGDSDRAGRRAEQHVWRGAGEALGIWRVVSGAGRGGAGCIRAAGGGSAGDAAGGWWSVDGAVMQWLRRGA